MGGHTFQHNPVKSAALKRRYGERVPRSIYDDVPIKTIRLRIPISQ